VTRRLRKFKAGDLDDAQHALYQEIVGGPRGQGPQLFPMKDENGGLEGPYNAMLLSPSLGSALQALGARVRYSGRLGDRARELAILTVGYAWDSGFEVYAHKLIARAAGLTETELAAIRFHQFDAFGNPAERTVVTLAHALVTRSDLTDEEYQAGREALGEDGLFELTTLVGYYAALALQMRVFPVQVPGEEEPTA
jgi:4-carboxymuconolactone decarboxylase